MCAHFSNLYVLSTWGPHMVYMGPPYTFYIYMMKSGWLGYNLLHVFSLHWGYYIATYNLECNKIERTGALLSWCWHEKWPLTTWGRYHMTSLAHGLVIHWEKLYCTHAQYPSILYTVLRRHCSVCYISSYYF